MQTILNTYAYVNGNPISLVDPWGLCTSDGFLNNVASNFNETNDATIGKVLQFAAGQASVFGASKLPGGTGAPAPIQWALNGFRGMGGYTALETGVTVAGNWATGTAWAVGAFQAGNLAGSIVSALPAGDGRTVRDVLSGVESCSCKSGK